MKPLDKPTYDDPVVLTPGSADKEYDGTPLTDNSVTVEGLPADFTCEAVISSSQTDVGVSANTVESYKIFDDSGTDVTERFTNVTLKNGTLTVTKLQIIFNMGGFKAEFENYPLLPEGYTGTYASSGASVAGNCYEVTGADERPAALAGQFRLTGGAVVVLTCNAMTDADSYTLTPSVDFTAGNPDNYELSYTDTDVVISPMQITFTLHWPADELVYLAPTMTTPDDITGYYDNFGFYIERYYSKHTDAGYTASFRPWGADITLYCQGISEAGTQDFTPTCTFNSGKSSNYNILYANTSIRIFVLGLSPAETEPDVPATGNGAAAAAENAEEAAEAEETEEEPEGETAEGSDPVGTEDSEEADDEAADAENVPADDTEESEGETEEDADAVNTVEETAEVSENPGTDTDSAEVQESISSDNESAEDSDTSGMDTENTEASESSEEEKSGWKWSFLSFFRW